MASQCNRKKNFVRVSIYLKQKRNARKYTVHFRKHEQNKRLNARKQKNLNTIPLPLDLIDPFDIRNHVKTND